jgi:hypothetical protein
VPDPRRPTRRPANSESSARVTRPRRALRGPLATRRRSLSPPQGPQRQPMHRRQGAYVRPAPVALDSTIAFAFRECWKSIVAPAASGSIWTLDPGARLTQALASRAGPVTARGAARATRGAQGARHPPGRRGRAGGPARGQAPRVAPLGRQAGRLPERQDRCVLCSRVLLSYSCVLPAGVGSDAGPTNIRGRVPERL